MTNILMPIVTILLYLAAACSQLLGLAGKWRYNKTVVWLLGCVAVILHGDLLHHWIDVSGGQNLALVNMLSLVGWLVSVLILIIALLKPLETLMVFIFPLTALSILLVLFFPGSQIINTAQDPKQLFHILLAVLTFSVLCIAGWQAILLAILEKQVRKKSMALIVKKLPPLQTMETLLFQIIGFGFFLLTIMILTSIYFFHDELTLPVIQKTILAILAWIVFGCLLLGRHYFGWRSRKAIYGTLIGVILLVVTYFGSILLLELLI